MEKGTIDERFRRALKALVEQVKQDRSVLAVILCGSLSHDQVWARSDIHHFGAEDALVEEGVELRRASIDAPILVLGAAYGLAHRDVLAYRLTPVLGATEDLARFRRAADELGQSRVDVHLKIDTGMARLGLRPGVNLERFCDELERTQGIMLSGLMTHLASAAESRRDAEPAAAGALRRGAAGAARARA